LSFIYICTQIYVYMHAFIILNFLNLMRKVVDKLMSLSKVYVIFSENFRSSLPSMASRHWRFMASRTPRKFVHKFHADSKRRHVSLFLSSKLSVTRHNYKRWLMLFLVNRSFLQKHPWFSRYINPLKIQRKRYFYIIYIYTFYLIFVMYFNTTIDFLYSEFLK